MPRQAFQEPTSTIVSTEEAIRLQGELGEERVNVSRTWYPWQETALICDAYEIGLFGGKGGGKSEMMRGFLIKGNPDLPDFDESGNDVPWNRSYIYHPEYRGLILRKNEGDLADFIKRAERMWKPLGGVYKNGRFEFPAGAVIDCGHMRDENAWMKYIGIEYQRIAIDEAGLIREYSLFEELRSCMRSPYKELRCQVMLASNSGGPGTMWIVERYMTVKDKSGLVIPHGNIITEEIEHPDTGEIHKRTRIWIFSTYKDNPLYKNSEYAVTLAGMQDPKKRRAYLEGHWDALFGSYFGDLFRPDGPVKANNEPVNACHVITHRDVQFQPWWHRSIGMDWGYSHESAILWACQSPDKRVYIYRELVAAQTSPEKLGYELALMTRDELNASPSHSMVLHLSHDAFNGREGDKSIAELIAMGIARVLGGSAVHLPDILVRQLRQAYANEPYNFRSQDDQEKAIAAIKLQRRIGITIRIAEKTGVIGWQHCREMLRWETIGKQNAQYDANLAQQLLQQDPNAFEEYCRVYRDMREEHLPKLQIIGDACPRLIKAIPKAQHEDGTENVDKVHFVGKDVVDCWLYLAMGMRDELPAEPYEAFRDRHLNEITRVQPSLTTNDLVRINMNLEDEWKEKDKRYAPYTPPRGARHSRMVMQGRIKPDRFNNGRV